jgi:hypothetical protein
LETAYQQITRGGQWDVLEPPMRSVTISFFTRLYRVNTI